MKLNKRKLTSGILCLSAVLGMAFSAQAEVKVSFSDSLNERMNRINAIEKKREKIFRQFRTEGTRANISRIAHFNISRFNGTEWGNERLVKELDDFTIPNLITGMFEKSIKEAAPDFDGDVLVHIDNLRVANSPLAWLTSFNTRMAGTVKLVNTDGEVIAETTLSTIGVPEFSRSRNYKGRDYAYMRSARNTRVGPIAAEFNEKVFKQLYPDYDARGAIFLSE